MKKHLVVFLLITLSSCELVVDVNVPLEKPQLTLNSLFNPDSLWNVKINLNRHVLSDEGFKSVDNAEVGIYSEGKLIETLSYKNGAYRSTTSKPQIGTNYEVKAVSSEYGSVSAHSVVPDNVHDLAIELEEEFEQQTTKSKFTIKLRFTDQDNQRNFYKLSVTGDRYFVASGQRIGKSSSPLYIKLKGQSDSDDVGDTEMLFSDILFDGMKHEMTIEATTHGIIPHVEISLCSISEDYYNYRQTSDLQSSTKDNPFAQPVNVYNNIIGGFGIFAGYSKTSFFHEKSAPNIMSISPMTGKPGDHVVITFNGDLDLSPGYQPYVCFCGVFNNMPVYFATPVTRKDLRSFEVIVPQNSVSGKLVIFVNGIPRFSEESFQVVN